MCVMFDVCVHTCVGICVEVRRQPLGVDSPSNMASED